MNNVSPLVYIAVFVLGCIFQAGGFWYVTKENRVRMRAFEGKLTETREDMAWIKGYLSKANGGKKR